uniref:U-box domain-containing protein n=1 Tax=Populus trichocarpa TaxID=3694 RepID=A0A3N7GJT3_POPTR
MLREESKLESFQFLFDQGTSKIKRSLCQIIEAISSSLETRELCAKLGKNRKLLKGLILLVHQTYGASEAGIKAISALCCLESNRENMVQEGGINGLLTYIYDAQRHERNLAPKAMATIELLLGLESAKEALINDPNDSLQAREEAIGAGVLTQLLLLLQSQCSGRTKTKARMLLKLLGSKWDEEPKHL